MRQNQKILALIFCGHIVACTPADSSQEQRQELTAEEVVQAICWGESRYRWDVVETSSEEERREQLKIWHAERKKAGVVFSYACQE